MRAQGRVWCVPCVSERERGRGRESEEEEEEDEKRLSRVKEEQFLL